MSNPEQPRYHMASLDQKRAQSVTRNLMAPGAGTPWEDRGAIGRVRAFFKTVFMSMFQPIRLTDLMRRPETSGDVMTFALSCGVFWAICIVVFAGFNLGPLQHVKMYDKSYPIPHQTAGITGDEPRYDVSVQTYWLVTAVIAVGVIAATWAVLKLASLMFEKLIAFDMPQRAPSVLFFNLMGYALGPSLLAVIPFYGWVAALLWIGMNWLVVAKARLGVKLAAAVIGSVLTMVVVFAIAFCAYYASGIIIQYFAATDLRV